MPRLSAADIAKLPPHLRQQIEAEYRTDDDGTPGRVTMSKDEIAQQQYKPRQAAEKAAEQASAWRALSDKERRIRLVRATLRQAHTALHDTTLRQYTEITGCNDASVAKRQLAEAIDRLERLCE